MEKERKKLIVVLGMHRSGTSALSGVLSMVGVDFGSTSKLYAPDADINAKGYWEHSGLVMQNEKALAILNSSWDDFKNIPENLLSKHEINEIKLEIKIILEKDFSGGSLIGIKDPRMCKLLPIWLDVFSEMGIKPYFAIIFRHPYEVTQSLITRDEMSSPKANLLWLSYVLSAEKHTRGYARSILTYDGLLMDWEASISGIMSDIDQKISATAQKKIEGFLSAGLRHSFFSDNLAKEAESGEWVAIAYKCMMSLSVNPFDKVANELLDNIRRELSYSLNLFSPLIYTENAAEKELLKLRHNYTDLLDSYNHVLDSYNHVHGELDAIKSSFIYRIIRQVNKVKSKFKY